MSKILLICAMDMEKAAAPSHCQVIISGPGFRKARLAAERALQESKPDLVVSIGTCGALRASMELGQAFAIAKISSDLGDFQPQPLKGSPAILRSQDRVAVTRQDKSRLASAGYDLVDMEAAVVAQVCQAARVPFAAMKAVSDLASEDFPLDFNRYRRSDGSFNQPKIAIAGIMKIRGLLRLQRQSRFAVEKLGDALALAL